MDSRLGLPANTVLDGSYRIERVVGSGGFGITYEAEDVNLGTAVAIKEYYPFDFGDRDATMSVKPKSDRHRQTFDWGRSNFLQEARTLARFEHPSVVRVTRVFEANSTAYMVMRFEQGHSFEAWLSSLGRLPTQEELDSIVAPLLDALQMMHAENFLHRDIAPDNIIVRTDGSPVLLDFGAARRAVAEMSRTMTGIVKAGYSPHEQYSSDSRLQGPWSDLYALGGTLYRAVTGHPPEEATLRVDEDHMPPAAQVARKSGYRPGFLSAIDACLKVRHSERPRSVAQLRPMMLGRRSQPRPGLERFVEAFKTTSKPPQKAPSRPPSGPLYSSRTKRSGPSGAQPAAARRWPAIAAAVVAVLGGAYGGFEYSRWQPAEQVDAAAKKKADEAAARRQQESRIAEERAHQDAEAKRLADATEAKRKADEDRARREVEAKRLADAAAARKKADEDRARQEAEAKRLADAAETRRKADEDHARQEAEAKRLADAAAARKKADEDRARQEAEAKRLADAAAAAKKKADDDRARQEAEAKRLADAAAAKKRADEEAQAKREQEERVAGEKAAAADAARRQAEAEAERSKTEDPQRVSAATLNTDERATFVKKIQEVLKQSKCYEGAINGSSDDAQKSLDRYVKTAHQKGKEKPVRIELAKATASDFDSWLREADDIKGGLCSPPAEKKPVQAKAPQEPKRQQSAEPRQRSNQGGGGGRIGPIQGIQ